MTGLKSEKDILGKTVFKLFFNSEAGNGKGLQIY